MPLIAKGLLPRLLAVAALAATVAACARPTGDFNRARPSVIHDDLMPALGRQFAKKRLEPVSDFNWTDDEGELRDRSFNFVRAPHLRDWWFDSLAEGERTRLLVALDGEGGPTPSVKASLPKFMVSLVDPAYDDRRYYRFLRSDQTRSSEVRWSRVTEDMIGDALLIPPFCAIVAKVRRADRERMAALQRQPDDPVFAGEAYDRVAENEAVVAWVWRALRLRLRSYRFAIDRLQVETPSAQLWETNRAYLILAGTRCEGDGSAKTVSDQGPGRRSRFADGPDPFDAPVPQK